MLCSGIIIRLEQQLTGVKWYRLRQGPTNPGKLSLQLTYQDIKHLMGGYGFWVTLWIALPHPDAKAKRIASLSLSSQVSPMTGTASIRAVACFYLFYVKCIHYAAHILPTFIQLSASRHNFQLLLNSIELWLDLSLPHLQMSLIFAKSAQRSATNSFRCLSCQYSELSLYPPNEVLFFYSLTLFWAQHFIEITSPFGGCCQQKHLLSFIQLAIVTSRD